MKKKVKNDSPAMAMLRAMGEDQSETKPLPKEETLEAHKRETKSHHLQLLIKPSTYEKLKQAAARSGQSINGMINDLLERSI